MHQLEGTTSARIRPGIGFRLAWWYSMEHARTSGSYVRFAIKDARPRKGTKMNVMTWREVRPSGPRTNGMNVNPYAYLRPMEHPDT
jgi:hypothetical protein